MSLLRRFILRTVLDVEALQQCVALNWSQMHNAGNALQVVVSVHKAKRREEQNALMWVHLWEIADQAWIAGRKFDAETWHEHFKREFLPDLCSKGVEKWAVLPSGERSLRMSTTDLNTKEFADYLTAIQAHVVSELGVRLSDKAAA